MAPLQPVYPTGVEELISKNSQGGKWLLTPGGLSQSNVGIKIAEPVPGAADWSVVGNWHIGFDPYSLQLSNGPGSMRARHSDVPLPFQNSNGDSSRAGQWDNSLAYVGVSNTTFGTLTFGREYSLTLDGVNAYDPMGGSYAFSPIGYSGKVRRRRLDRGHAPQQRVQVQRRLQQFPPQWLGQVGGYDQGNGSNGEYEDRRSARPLLNSRSTRFTPTSRIR